MCWDTCMFDMMVCHLHTFQNWAPLNQNKASGFPDEPRPLWSSDHNSQSNWLGDDISVHRIGTLCTVGGLHRYALFCVEGKLPHSSHTLPVPTAHHANSDEPSSVDGLSIFGLVVSKVSSSGVGPSTTGILVSTGWLLLLHTMQLWVGLFCWVLFLNRAWNSIDFDRLITDHTSYSPELEFGGTLTALGFLSRQDHLQCMVRSFSRCQVFVRFGSPFPELSTCKWRLLVRLLGMHQPWAVSWLQLFLSAMPHGTYVHHSCSRSPIPVLPC